jgi:HEAT repeat protein
MGANSNVRSHEVFDLIAVLGDDNGQARQHARERLVEIGEPAAPALVAALSSPEEQVRWEAAKALSEIAAPASAPGLVAALEDREFSVRWLAAEALVAIGHRSIVPVLEGLVQRGHSQWLRDGAHHVLKALSRRTASEELARVLAAIEGPEPELVAPPAAQSALEAMGHKGG